MSAYIIFIRNSISDPDEMKIYQSLAPAASAKHDVTAIARYGAAEALEGENVEGVVIVRFESMDAAKAWYYSPEYQRALPHRLKGSDYRVILTDGIA